MTIHVLDESTSFEGARTRWGNADRARPRCSYAAEQKAPPWVRFAGSQSLGGAWTYSSAKGPGGASVQLGTARA